MLTFRVNTGVFDHFWPKMPKPGRAFGPHRACRALFLGRPDRARAWSGLRNSRACRAGLGRASGWPVALSEPLLILNCDYGVLQKIPTK